jgi:glycosyltransferase involved in cell wall biosynthesis
MIQSDLGSPVRNTEISPISGILLRRTTRAVELAMGYCRLITMRARRSVCGLRQHFFTLNSWFMRIFWASHIIPYPPKSGVHLRSYNLLRGVAAQHDVDLLAFIQEPWLDVFYPSRREGLEECTKELGKICRSVRFLPIDSLKRPGGKLRTAVEGLLYPTSYTIRWLQSAQAHAAFGEAARRTRYSLVHFDTIGLAPFRAHFPGTPASLGHHNIESHMLARRGENERNIAKRLYFLLEGARVRRYEARMAGEFDLNITCSELDSARLRDVAPSAHAVVIPNGVDTEYFQPTQSDSPLRSIIFVGSLNWYPNVDAVHFLLREVWPAAKARHPDLRLDIVGSAPPSSVLSLAAKLKDVRVHGFVHDVRPLLNAATLYVCPIRDGGGTKLKLLDAFAMEKCVIAHPVACEGIDVSPGVNVQLADSAKAFGDGIDQLMSEPAARLSIGRAARSLVVERYSFSQIGRQLCDLFESTANGARAARNDPSRQIEIDTVDRQILR